MALARNLSFLRADQPAMGEFPDPAIRGSEVPLSTSASTAPAPSGLVEPVESDPVLTSPEDVVTTTEEPSLTPVASWMGCETGAILY